MDQKSIMLTRKRMNELASSHNKLTTLVACLLNEINSLKKDLYESRGGSNDTQQQNRSNDNNQQNNRTGSNNRFSNFNELRAEEILKQLTINTNDN